MIKKKSLKIVLAVIAFVLISSAGTIIDKIEGDKFVIETVTHDENIENIGAAKESDNGKININTAPADELVMLDGIGEKLADRIIKYRSEHGDFEVIEELALVKGISENTVKELADKICVK